VKNLARRDFEAIEKSVPSVVSAILDRPNIAMLTNSLGDSTVVEMFLSRQLQRLADSVNIDARLNLQPHQIPAIAEELVKKYPVETLEDFVLCFKRGAFGYYGSIYRIDAAVLCEWMAAYLEEKYALIEAEHTRRTQEANSEINYAEYIKRMEKEDSQPKERVLSADENAYQRWKLERKRMLKKFVVNGVEVEAFDEKQAEEIYQKIYETDK